MSNETKIGILAVVAVAVLIWGYKFLQGQNILSSSDIYYAEYKDVDQLKSSAPVLMNGYEIGVVTDMYFKKGGFETITIEIRIELDVDLPENTMAVIIDQGFMGGKAIEMVVDIPCSAELPCPDRKNYLRGETQSFLQSVIGKPEEVKDYLNAFSEEVNAVIDSLKGAVGIDAEDGGGDMKKTFKDLQETISYLKSATRSLSKLLNASSDNLIGITGNLDSITGTIKDNSDDLQKIMNNAAGFTDQLAEMELKGMVDDAQATVKELKTTLTKSQETFDKLNGILAGLNENESTIGRLINDDGELYDEFTALGSSLDSLTSDLQAHPYLYLPFKTVKGVERKKRKAAKISSNKD